MKTENHVKLVEGFNTYCLYVDVDYYGMLATEIADIIQEYDADYLNVLEVRYSSETKTGTIIFKEKGKIQKQEIERVINNTLQEIKKNNTGRSPARN